MAAIFPIAAWRLHLLRAGYLLLVVGLGAAVWPSILDPGVTWEASRGVVVAMLGALSLLAVAGLFRPLAFLPLLLWEVTWKALWLLRVALPLWHAHRLDAATTGTAVECLMAGLIVAVVPWDHVARVVFGGNPRAVL